MPYSIAWGPRKGGVIVVTETARQAMRVISERLTDSTDGPAEIASLAGAPLSWEELVALARAELQYDGPVADLSFPRVAI